MSKAQEEMGSVRTSRGHVGVVFDLIDQIQIERSPNVRKTSQEAYKDALALADYINANKDDYNGRTVDHRDCFVAFDDGGIDFGFDRTDTPKTQECHQ